MPAIWTHGVWAVTPGREDESVAAWREMSRDALAETVDRFRAHIRPIGEVTESIELFALDEVGLDG